MRAKVASSKGNMSKGSKKPEPEQPSSRAPRPEAIVSGLGARGLGCSGSGFLLPLDIFPFDEATLARIIHERFYCNRGFAAPTSLHAPSTACRRAGRPLGPSTYCFKYASVPLGSSLTHCMSRATDPPLTRLRDFGTNRHELCGLHRWVIQSPMQRVKSFLCITTSSTLSCIVGVIGWESGRIGDEVPDDEVAEEAEPKLAKCRGMA